MNPVNTYDVEYKSLLTGKVQIARCTEENVIDFIQTIGMQNVINITSFKSIFVGGEKW